MDSPEKQTAFASLRASLGKPFPFLETRRQRILSPVLFAAFIYLFLMVFQPFGISGIVYHKPVFVMGFFGITLVVMLLSNLLVPVILPKAFNPDKWTVRKNIRFIIWQIISIGFFNWLYNSTVGKDFTRQDTLLIFELSTFAVGIFPVILLTFYTEKYLSRKHESIADDLTHRIHPREDTPENRIIKIVSDNDKDFISLDLQHFICVESEGNYVLVYYYQNKTVKRQFIRNSLTAVGEQLTGYDSVMRCHRSYIVNFQNVVRFTGNARNYNLHIEHLDFTIPVSRSFPKTILENIKKQAL